MLILTQSRTGPISVAVHIPIASVDAPLDALNEDLAVLHHLVASSPALTTRVDIHLVVSPFVRAFNAWRNLARMMARTDYVLMLDVDFAVTTDWRGVVRGLVARKNGADGMAALRKEMREGYAALVLPAFEYVVGEEGEDQTLFPGNKEVCYQCALEHSVS